MTDTTQQLTGLDRWTLRLWRGTNIAAWSLAAFLTALFFRLGIESAAALVGRSFADPQYGHLVFALSVEAPASLLCGGAIGTMLGARVYGRPALVTAIVSLAYAVAVSLAELSYPATRVERIIVAAAVLVSVPVAIWSATRGSRTRPKALRGGRL